MNKKILGLIFCFSLFLLTGCCHETASIYVEEDGSSEVSIQATINKDEANYLKNLDEKTPLESNDKNDVTPLFRESANKFRKRGFTIIPISNSIEIGYRATKKLISATDFNKEVKELNKLKLINSNLKLYANTSVKGAEYLLKGDFKYVKDDSYEKMIKKLKKSKFDIPDMSKTYLDLTVKMPGETVKINSKKNMWTSFYEDKKPIKVYYKTKVINKKFIVVISIIGVLFIILILVFVFKKIKR